MPATSQISGTITDGVTLTAAAYTNPLTITSTGSIYASGKDALYAGQSWAIDNQGTITQSYVYYGAFHQFGVDLSQGGSLTNEAGALISGYHGFRAAGDVTVDNFGAISGTRGGIVLDSTGTIINQSTGTITGLSGGLGINGGNSTTTIINYGTVGGERGIQQRAGYFSNAASGYVYGGFSNLSYGSLTVVNAGRIVMHQFAPAVQIGYHQTVVNEASGTISSYQYGVQAGNNSTVENAGTIIGGRDAVVLGSEGRLIVDVGAVFSGYVRGNGGTLELKSGASTGTINGLHSKYLGFDSVTIDSGAAWDITGTSSDFLFQQIHGFDSHDRLDLTDLTFDAGDTISIYGGSELIISNAGGTTLAMINMDSGITADQFTLVSDGLTGTFLEETGYSAACYLKGTLIRTPGGEVAVEALGIGDLVQTADGEALPVKWIGRRSYRDWIAVGNDQAQPVCFKAGSIADHVPARDLYVSPEHAMFLDGILVPAHLLVNGTSVVKIGGVEEIDYFHLEFDRHVVIFADGAAAESFVDDDSRMLFHNADEYRRLYPDEPGRTSAQFCAPRVEEGPALARLHRMLATRSAHLRPDGAAAPWGRRGKLEVATNRLVAGWAFSGADAGPVALAVLVNGALVGRVVADRYRADLEVAGIGDGRHAFNFVLPKGLDPGIDHRIEVRREIDWSLL